MTCYKKIKTITQYFCPTSPKGGKWQKWDVLEMGKMCLSYLLTAIQNHIKPVNERKSSMTRDANLVKRFAVFLGLKESSLDEKTVFSPTVQYTCVVINLEKKQYFPKSCSIYEVFSSKNSTKYCKKVTLGIPVWHILQNIGDLENKYAL